MKVKLVWVTPNAQDLIVYIARVSNPKSQEEGANPERLIRYLTKHRHWSPFEMAHACYCIDTTRDMAHQLIRHWSIHIEEFRFQEFSQRYADVDQIESAPNREARMQDPKNRQSSVPTDDQAIIRAWEEMQNEVRRVSDEAYRNALELGIAKEVARVVLPEGLTPTRVYMVGSIRSWIHYCGGRREVGTQKEHRDIAEAIWQDLLTHIPAMKDAITAVEIPKAHESKYPLDITVGPKGKAICRTEDEFIAEQKARAL